MAQKLQKMRFLLLIPGTGVVIIAIYIKIKSMKDASFKVKHWMRDHIIVGLIFNLSTLIFIFLFVPLYVNELIFNNLEEDVAIQAILYICQFISGYVISMPYLIYVNRIIKKLEEPLENPAESS